MTQVRMKHDLPLEVMNVRNGSHQHLRALIPSRTHRAGPKWKEQTHPDNVPPSYS